MQRVLLASASEIYRDAKLYNQFDQDDKETISYAHKNKKPLPIKSPLAMHKYFAKLSSIESERSTNKKLFKIELMKNGIPYLKKISSGDMLTHKNILNFLSGDDAYQIGFHSGQEYAAKR